MALSLILVNHTSAFDIVSGGGEALVTRYNVDNSTREILSNLQLTTNAAVTSQTVTITLPAGTGALEFSNNPVAITALSGNFTVLNLNQSPTQIDFEITGSGTLEVQNIGVYGTNFVTQFFEDRFLNINFNATNFSGDFFKVDTRDFAVGFGGGSK